MILYERNLDGIIDLSISYGLGAAAVSLLAHTTYYSGAFFSNYQCRCTEQSLRW